MSFYFFQGELYTEIAKDFEPNSDQVYMEMKEMDDGIYSGFTIRSHENMIVRHGPGTLLDKDQQWKMEGKWANNEAFDGIGTK